MAAEDVTKYRSAVGKILYIAPDRPDIQFVAQGLASLMQRPDQEGMEGNATCEFLFVGDH